MEIQDNIQWHPAFCSAVELELREYKKYLTYEREHNLGRMPLKEACKAAGTVQRKVLRDPEESGDLPHRRHDLSDAGSCDEGTRQGIPRMDHVPDTNAKQG